MLTLAFDTATDVATSALARGRRGARGEDGNPGVACSRTSTRSSPTPTRARRSLGESSSARARGASPALRMGLAASRALALALDCRVAGVSTLDALAAGAPGALPVIDARRREVFTLIDGEPVAAPPDRLGNSLFKAGFVSGDGAVRYRGVLEAAGAEVPPDDSELHVPRAAASTLGWRESFGPAELVEPIYVRVARRRQGAEAMIEFRKLEAPRPGRDRGDRARLVSDPVVALDVRRRAGEAVLDLPRRRSTARPTSSSAT